MDKKINNNDNQNSNENLSENNFQKEDNQENIIDNKLNQDENNLQKEDNQEENESEIKNNNSNIKQNPETNNNYEEISTSNNEDLIAVNLEKYKEIFDNNNENENYKKDYQWDYEKYNKIDQASKDKSKKNKGVIIFASILGAVFIIPIIIIGGITIYKKIPNLLPDISSNISSLSRNANDLTANLKDNFSITDNNDSITDNNSIFKNNDFSNSSPTLPATKIAKKVIPSVVSIIPYARVQSFYQTGVTEIGGASGIIIKSDGYIITNAHVVLNLNTFQPVDALKVVLSNNQEYEAKIIGVDINTDLAVIKIETNNLPVADFGNSDNLEVGETVFAIGSPIDIDFAGSMTMGIVSALNRSGSTNSSLGSDNKYIQTDAAINPGNSGGALVNIKGQVVGINARKGLGIDVEGMGFAIPINEVASVIDDLINVGHVKGRVKLGITVGKEIDEIISRLNNVKTGLMVSSVDSNPDLVQAGILPYDILHEFNGVKIYNMQELKDQLKKHKPEDTVHLVFYRYSTFGGDETKIEVDVKLIEDPGIIQK